MDAKAHWEAVHEENAADEVSWFQREPAVSLRMLGLAGAGPDASVLDVGTGARGLACALAERGWRRVAALDVSAAALERAKESLGPLAPRVAWIEGDVLAFAPGEPFDVWHDRAVFHFLVEPRDRRAYADALRRSLRPGGHAVVATFAPDGPERCSGLPVARHDAEGVARELGLDLLRAEREEHATPWGATQAFAWALMRRPA